MMPFSRFVGLGACLFALGAAAESPDRLAFGCTEEDSDIAPIFQAPPYYPHSALMYCLTGSATLSLTIDEHGMTRDIKVVESQPAGVFDRSAVAAVERWRFRPACRGGQPAAREATQTIEFRLPEESTTECRRRADNLDEATVELLGQLGARYALLAEVHLGEVGLEALEAAVAVPLGPFEGDEAAVARFHQGVLERIVTAGRETDPPAATFDDVLHELNPYSLAEHDGLSKLRAVMTDYRAETLNMAERVRESQAKLQSEFEALKQATTLSSRALDRLITPFLGRVSDADADASIETAFLEPIDHLQALVDLLELRQGQWRVDAGRVVFEQQADQVAWDEQMQVMLSRRDELRNEERSWLRSFRDYSE